MDIRCEFTDMVDVGALIPDPRNANMHDDRQISILAKNIEHQGFRHPIIVSKLNNKIAAGHGRLMAAQKLGMTKVPVDYQDFDSEADQFRFMIADNKISSLATHDDNLMIEGIKGLDLIDSDFELLGLDDFSLESLEISNTGAELDLNSFDNFAHQCPKCGFEWDDSGKDNS